jgi:hypothetical protein
MLGSFCRAHSDAEDWEAGLEGYTKDAGQAGQAGVQHAGVRQQTQSVKPYIAVNLLI